MKKIIFIFALLLSIGAGAAVTSPAVELDRDGWYDKFTGTSADTSSVYNVWSKIIMPNKPDRLFYDFRVKVTEVSATTNTSIVLKGKKMAGDAWTPIDTIQYYGAGTDTTVIFSEVSTAVFWRFLQVYIAPANGKVKTTTIETAFKK